MKKLIFLDFEFSGVANFNLDLICAAVICRVGGVETERKSFWLADGSDSDAALEFFKRKIDEGYTFISYSLEAECRALFTLFQREIDLPSGVDLYLEWLQLINKNNEYCYGEQLIGGEVVETTPPRSKWERDDSEGVAEGKRTTARRGLSAAVFKMTGAKIDTARKEEVRAICIRNNAEEIKANRKEILDYCASDVEHLPQLLMAVCVASVKALYRHADDVKSAESLFWEHANRKASYAVATAKMVRHGYPIDYDGILAFDRNTVRLLVQAAKDCNEAAASDGLVPFLIAKDGNGHRQQKKMIQTWVAERYPDWPKTDGGQASLSRETVSKYFKDDSPGFPGAYRRFKSIEESVKGFGVKASAKKKSFFDYVGTDKRVRHHHGIYGSATARSQHGSTGFLPAKSKWMKAGLQAPHGFALVELDYSQQEYLIQACISGDEKMRASYDDGDPYMVFAIAAGLAPANATKKTHKRERDIAKALVLGIGYDKGPAALAAEITANGTPMDSDGAAALINKFYETYAHYAEFKDKTQRLYKIDGGLRLVDGWALGPDNTNFRSVGNFPIQGSGSVIMRAAVKRAQKLGLKVLYTMHDSITIEIPSNAFDQIELLKRTMIDTFRWVTKTYFPLEGNIRVSGEAWSLDYDPLPSVTIPDVKFLRRYVIDETRAKWELYGKYFE